MGGFCTYWPLQGESLNVLRDLEMSVIHSQQGPLSMSLGLLLGPLFPKFQGLTCICFTHRLTQYRPHRRLDFLKPQWLCSDSTVSTFNRNGAAEGKFWCWVSPKRPRGPLYRFGFLWSRLYVSSLNRFPSPSHSLSRITQTKLG